MDWVRDIGGAKLAVDRDLECEPDSGEVVRGRYGKDGVDVLHEGDAGDVGIVSAERDRIGRFFAGSGVSNEGRRVVEEFGRRRDGIGDGWNSSIRSVSGTGSMVVV